MNVDNPDQGWRRQGEDYLSLLLRLFLGGLFIYSAWHKIADPITFMIKVSEYEILPPSWEEPFAYVLPWVMAVSGVLLAAGFLTRGAGLLQALMLASFLLAIGVNVYRERVLGCGCFSEEGHQVGFLLLGQDFLLLMLSSYLIWRGGRRFSLDALFPRQVFSSRGSGS